MYIAHGDIAYNMDRYDGLMADENNLLLIRDDRYTKVATYDEPKDAEMAFGGIMRSINNGTAVMWL